MTNVVILRESNYRQAAPTLRKIADEIDAGDFGEITCCGVVLRGNDVAIFGAGPQSDAPETALLFYAAFQKLVMA